MEHLPAVVPLVDGLVDVHALVALQPDQPPARRSSQHFGHLGLANAGFSFQEQRLGQPHRQENRGGERAVGHVPLAGERVLHLLDGLGHRWERGGSGVLRSRGVVLIHIHGCHCTKST